MQPQGCAIARLLRGTHLQQRLIRQFRTARHFFVELVEALDSAPGIGFFSPSCSSSPAVLSRICFAASSEKRVRRSHASTSSCAMLRRSAQGIGQCIEGCCARRYLDDRLQVDRQRVESFLVDQDPWGSSEKISSDMSFPRTAASPRGESAWLSFASLTVVPDTSADVRCSLLSCSRRAAVFTASP